MDVHICFDSETAQFVWMFICIGSSFRFVTGVGCAAEVMSIQFPADDALGSSVFEPSYVRGGISESSYDSCDDPGVASSCVARYP